MVFCFFGKCPYKGQPKKVKKNRAATFFEKIFPTKNFDKKVKKASQEKGFHSINLISQSVSQSVISFILILRFGKRLIHDCNNNNIILDIYKYLANLLYYYIPTK